MKSSIKFSSELQNISLAEQVIDNLSTQFNISAEVYGNILVSIVEAVNNAIKHGNRLNEAKFVELSYEVSDHDILFVVKDEGPGFDYSNIADPTTPENLEKPDGRGVFLIMNLADEVEFYDKGATISMKFNF